MKLYFSPGACSLSPHIVLRETGVPFELEQVDLRAKKTKDGADFLQVNPKGQVPVLALDDGDRLTEGPAIVQYIADKAPGSGLVPPAGSKERYQVQEWLNFITSELHKNFSPLSLRLPRSQARRPQVPDGRPIHDRRCLSFHHPELDQVPVDRPRPMAQLEGLCGTRRRAAQGPGRHEGGRPAQSGLAKPALPFPACGRPAAAGFLRAAGDRAPACSDRG